ncbi:Phosphatidylserine decarboxylase [Liberibacter crescens BT-1]|uniref:Phosphatidylserine decarboxylase proenzyme n=1 Tax=Liberibacter crescens (strain BT-1) TaxID=1215343 RepID=L0EWT4_LIBCB|nr:phosphatidylserine decarboxylase [Liberibacter crescens]AGA65108.1 Phosphatidylserine decarboxylase [Liberibacter crescens BT-1]AMC13085.1 phosphatidylserine decarboxylase [Liberibacter crescens]
MQIIQTIRKMMVPIHRQGWPFVIILVCISIFCSFTIDFLFWPSLIMTAWCAYFFRDPERVTPLDNDLVISPADGRVSSICTVVPPPELELGTEPMIRISIFMNIFDCHINRAPVSGEVIRSVHHNGQFISADLDKASEQNERHSVLIQTIHGKIGVIQIAGFAARRIICWIKPTMKIDVGERFGLIRFGSRVDLFLPEHVNIRTAIDQRTIAGETVLAEFNSSRKPMISYHN